MHLLACSWCLIATMWGSLRDSVPGVLEKHVTDCMAGACVVEEFNGACTGCVKDEQSPWHTQQTQTICDANPCLTECELAIMEVANPNPNCDCTLNPNPNPNPNPNAGPNPNPNPDPNQARHAALRARMHRGLAPPLPRAAGRRVLLRRAALLRPGGEEQPAVRVRVRVSSPAP